MRITIATGPWYSVPPAPCGAVERVWYGLAPKFAERGHEVTFLCRSWGDLPGNEVRDGVRYIRRTHFSMTQRLPVDLIKDFFYTARMLPKIPRADVLVTNNVWMPLLMSRVPGSPWGKIVPSVARMPKRQMKYYLRAGRLTPVSNAVAREIVKQCPEAARLISVVPNPIDTGVFTPLAAAGPKPRGQQLLYAGRIHPEKGLDLLMRAFARLCQSRPDARLLLVGAQRIEDGGGGESFVRHLKALAGNASVEFRDPVYGRRALADVYRSADVFVYPSVAEAGESFGVAPLEAMACGLITIVSDLEPFKEFIVPDENGLVFDHRTADPSDALTSAMLRALDDTDANRRMAAAAIETGKRYSYDAVADLYLADWSAMLRKEPPPVAVAPNFKPEDNQKLRISIVTGPFSPPPPGQAGAVERRWYNTARRFAALGHQVTFLSRRIPGYPSEETIDGVRFIRHGELRMTQILLIDLIKDFFYTLRLMPSLPKSDVLVTNNVWLPIIATRFLGGCGRVVCNVARMPKGQMGYSLRAGRFSAVSTAVALAIKQQSPKAAPLISVVPNPIDIDAFTSIEPSMSETNAHSKTPLILYTGRINAEKGLELLIDAFRTTIPKHPGARLKIMGAQEIPHGGGGPAYIESLRDRGAGLPMEVAPAVYDRAELAEIYRSASVYVYPSVADLGESFGVAPLEAMACAVPTIVSALACFEEFLTADSTGLVFDHHAPDAVEQLAQRIDSVLSSPELAIRLGHKAAERARKFSYTAVADMYLADWREMLAGRPGNFSVSPALSAAAL